MSSFPLDLTSVLTGASVPQLRRWSRSGLLVPEIHQRRPMLYSFRDLLALRTVVRLRADASLQKIRRAFATLPEFELTDHPSSYKLATDGSSIAVWTDDGFLDLVKHPGHYQLFTMRDIFESFESRGGAQVVDFQRPRQHLVVDARRMGGWPTIEGTRVTYDTIAEVVDGETITLDDLPKYYPGVSRAAAVDALDFDADVRGRKQAA